MNKRCQRHILLLTVSLINSLFFIIKISISNKSNNINEREDTQTVEKQTLTLQVKGKEGANLLKKKI